MQAVVLAGGRGSRLGGDAAPPKPLTPVAGVAMLDHVLCWLARHGVRDVVLCTAFKAEMIEAHVGDGARYGVRARYSVEASPLGTAGAVRLAAPLLDDRFLVVYGDVLADVDLAALEHAHVSRGALATLAVHPNDHPFDSDRVVTDAAGWIRRMVRKEDRVGPEAGGLCSAALYVAEKRLLERVDPAAPSDFARDVFPRLALAGERLYAFRTAEYLKDMGTTERRAKVEKDLGAGVVARMRRATPKVGVLVDRDGVLNEDVPFIRRPDELALLPGAAGALRRLNQARVVVGVCTNQPVVARGEVDEEGLHGIHTHLEGLLGGEGAWVDDVFVCPHHTDRGFPGERADLKIPCACRKPRSGLLFEAIARLGIDPRRSVFVGDRTSDLRAARGAGVLGVGVLTGKACTDRAFPIDPETPLVASLAEAAALVLDTAPSWEPHLDRVLEAPARVVLLGGPSRSGKTTAAAALALALASRGVEVTRLSLDRFITPFEERAPDATLLERTRFAAASEAVRALVAGTSVLVPGYDPLTRSAAPGEVLTWSRTGVLVVDGLLACDVAIDGALRVALRADDADLEARRTAFYAWKNTSREAPAPDLSRALQLEERAAIDASRARADLALRLDTTLRLTIA